MKCPQCPRGERKVWHPGEPERCNYCDNPFLLPADVQQRRYCFVAGGPPPLWWIRKVKEEIVSEVMKHSYFRKLAEERKKC